MKLNWKRDADGYSHRLFEVTPEGMYHLLAVLRHGLNQSPYFSVLWEGPHGDSGRAHYLEADFINTMTLDEARRYIETLWRLST